MVFEFDGELLSPSSFRADSYIEDQLLYTIGQLNGSRSVGRLDDVTLSNITTTREGSSYRVRYHAKLPVAWGSKTNLPSSYQLILPLNMDSAAIECFTTAAGPACADSSAHDLEAGNYWYYYRPSRSGCTVPSAQVVRARATATVSNENTKGNYPELHKVWEDNTLVVVSIFGKYEDGATTDDDAGIAAYNRFLEVIQDEFGNVTTTPANLPAAPGVASPDVTIETTRADGRRVRVHALLVDNVRTAGAGFDARYGALSTEADLIAYNGHAGLGSNVRALVRKGNFRAGKYQIIFMNGCDTFAYVDGALAEARAALNPEDPTGTKFMEIITNARPSYFASNASNDLALIRGLLSPTLSPAPISGCSATSIARRWWSSPGKRTTSTSRVISLAAGAVAAGAASTRATRSPGRPAPLPDARAQGRQILGDPPSRRRTAGWRCRPLRPGRQRADQLELRLPSLRWRLRRRLRHHPRRPGRPPHHGRRLWSHRQRLRAQGC